LDLITLARNILDKADRIMIAGGREITFKERQNEIFEAGANSIVIGNYLTTAGREARRGFDDASRAGI
jgi:biotin synthase